MRSTDHKRKVRLHTANRLVAGQKMTLSSQQAHYVARVMRIGEGEAFYLFNGDCGEWLARIESVKRDAVSLITVDCVRPPLAEQGPILAFAAIKKDGMDFIAIKATELGVARLSPMITERSVVTRVNHDRLHANAIEAAEQCGRLSVPNVDPAQSLEDVLVAWPPAIPLFAMSPRGDVPIYDAVSRVIQKQGDVASPPGFLIGPEGGFSPAEEARFSRSPVVSRITMGERILRTETAAVAVLACWQAIAGDWRARAD